MLKAARTYKEIGYDGMLMPDHVPNVDGDPDHIAGIRVRDRLHQGDHRGGERRSVETKNEKRRANRAGAGPAQGPPFLFLAPRRRGAEPRRNSFRVMQSER